MKSCTLFILICLFKKIIYEWFPLKWEEKDQKSNARLFTDTFKLFNLLFKIFIKKNFSLTIRKIIPIK